MNADGTDRINVTNSGGEDESSPAWSPVLMGEVTVGSSNSVTVEVSNRGTASLDVSNVDVQGPFSVNKTGFNVSPGAIETLTITFNPTVAGPQIGNVTLTSNDVEMGPTVILVAGTGLAPAAPGARVERYSL